MTATAPLPKSIRARVHEDAIGRVTRFFNASIEQTLAELFQNARRSGATRVDVRSAGNVITVTDDGNGIKDPAALLAFGQSAWNNQTIRKEDPAGMGIYSLARQPKVVIQSRVRPRDPDSPAAPGWQVHLTPEHFLGQRSAAVNTTGGDRMPFGTQIEFRDEKETDDSTPAAAQFRAAGVQVRRPGRRTVLPAAGQPGTAKRSNASTSCTTHAASRNGAGSGSESAEQPTARERKGPDLTSTA